MAEVWVCLQLLKSRCRHIVCHVGVVGVAAGGIIAVRVAVARQRAKCTHHAKKIGVTVVAGVKL